MVEVFGVMDLPTLLLLVGAALVIAEAFLPGGHFFVVGIAMFVAGLVGLVVAPALGWTGTLFVLAAVVMATALVTLYAYRRVDIYGGPGAGRTMDSNSLRGQTGRVTEAVSPQEGEVKLDDGGFNPYYRARSVDGTIEEGEEVMVVDPGGGNVLTVESLADVGDEIDRELARGRAAEAERERDAESS